MNAKYEWRSEKFGVGHPSLVIIDITDVPEQLKYSNLLGDSRVKELKVKKINDFNDCFNGGRFRRSCFRLPKGYTFNWYDTKMNNEYYAVIVAISKIQ